MSLKEKEMFQDNFFYFLLINYLSFIFDLELFLLEKQKILNNNIKHLTLVLLI